MPRIQFNPSRKQATFLITGVCALMLFALATPTSRPDDATYDITYRMVSLLIYLGLAWVLAYLVAYIARLEFFLTLRILVIVFTLLGSVAQIARRSPSGSASQSRKP